MVPEGRKETTLGSPHISESSAEVVGRMQEDSGLKAGRITCFKIAGFCYGILIKRR